jgi:hypothetical protein
MLKPWKPKFLNLKHIERKKERKAVLEGRMPNSGRE